MNVGRNSPVSNTNFIICFSALCEEPGVQTLPNGRRTIVIYASKKEVRVNARTRPAVVKALVRAGAHVFGAAAPVSKHVIKVFMNLQGKQLSAELLENLRKRNRKYSPYRLPKDFQLLILWLEEESKRTRSWPSSVPFRTWYRANLMQHPYRSLSTQTQQRYFQSVLSRSIF